MKIFTPDNSTWGAKVNFVDNNNVLVGYDMESNCCEDFGWYISQQKRNDTDDDIPVTDDVEGYVFDPGYFEQSEIANGDCGGIVRFRLICEGKPDLFLHLFNDHNGYYAHGFTVSHSGVVIKDDCL